MAEPVDRSESASSARPFPPGRYPVVVIGSGAGGLQMSYALRSVGVDHALLSEDHEPGGMFRRFPFFQRLISWTKPHAPVERDSRAYLWFDWNSLLADKPEEQAPVWEFMDGTSYFPARSEMEAGLVAFAQRTAIQVRYGCRWEGTKKDDDGFTLTTSDGEYRCDVAVFAMGMTEPWKPDIPGLEAVPHYVDCQQAPYFAGKRVFIIGKRNSGFELADGLLPNARQIVLASPRPARLSVFTHSTSGARARYIQPYEDHILAGGTLVLDAAIERVERAAAGYRVFAKGTTVPGDWVFDVDEVLAATGFGTPLRDLTDLGVATFYQNRLPAQTPFWESASVPGVYFGGSIMQGSVGLKKYGMASSSAAVHGFRFNSFVLARHLAERRFGVEIERPAFEPDQVVPFLLAEAAHAPELWNQQGYLTRVLTFDPGDGIRDEGVLPLAHFVDSTGPDAVAVSVETDDKGDIHPAVYCRRSGKVDEHTLVSNPLMDFETAEHRAQLDALVAGLLR